MVVQDASMQSLKALVGGAPVSAWMFPWERRQMEGGTPLRTWEKLYWGLFVGGLAFLLYSRLFLADAKKPDPKASARHSQFRPLPWSPDHACTRDLQACLPVQVT